MPKRPREDEEIEVDEPPVDVNPYQVLSVAKDASAEEIKKAYRKGALQHHPDKVASEDKDAAHKKFQEVAFAYAILSDDRRRKRYDTTGRTEESLDLDDDDFDWVDFFRAQFSEVVTKEKIDAFSEEYRGSEEEQHAVLKAYMNSKGNMIQLYQQVMLSDMAEDEDRFRSIIDAAIEAGEVESYAKYANETEKSRNSRIAQAVKRKEKEAPEAEQAKLELEEKLAGKGKKGKKSNGAGDDLGDLAALIQQRQKGREQNFFDNLEAKWGAKDKKGKHAGAEGPSEEAFAANRKVKRSKK